MRFSQIFFYPVPRNSGNKSCIFMVKPHPKEPLCKNPHLDHIKCVFSSILHCIVSSQLKKANNNLKLSVDLVKHGCFTNLGDYKSNWITTNQIKLILLVFRSEGKTRVPKENLAEQSREPTNSTYVWQ